MSNNLETNNNIPQPDPDWDYYEIWQLLESIRNKIDRGFKIIADKEQADAATDAKLKEILELASDRLEEIIESHLTNYFYEK